MTRFLAIAAVAVSLLVTAHAQTQTHQLRDVSSGHCMTSSMTLQSCDGTPAQRWEYEAQTVPAPLSVGLFSSTAAPVQVTEADGNAVSLGMKFSTNTAGTISGVRFYKGPQNTGTHTGNLWDANGHNLATATFANETASGWQSVNFPAPINITAGTTYVVSYHTSTGYYSADANYFKSAVTANGITAPAGAGLFAYGADAFPNATYQGSNYWVDVQFNPGASVAVNGACGSANGIPVSSAPTTNLCATGTASAVTGSGPWSWACAGQHGGTTANNCSAPVATAATQGKLTIGVNGPWDTSIVPKPQWVVGPDGKAFQTWTVPGDYTYWENAVGMPVGSSPSSGGGIAMDGGWSNYEGSAWTMVQWMYTQGRGPDRLWLNIPPFPQHEGHKLADVANGQFDAHYKQVASQLKNNGYDRITWRPIWEFEGGWYEWGWKSGYQPSAPQYCTDYVAAFRDMVAAIRSVMPQARFVFNAADGTIMVPYNGGDWRDCYPGDDVTDEVAIDTYDGLRSQKTPADARWQQDQVPGITDSQALALAHHKGWSVPEWAIGAMGDNPLFIKNMAAAARAYMAHGLPVMVGYWNSTDPNTGYKGYMNTDENPLSWAEFVKDFHVPAKGRKY